MADLEKDFEKLGQPGNPGFGSTLVIFENFSEYFYRVFYKVLFLFQVMFAHFWPYFLALEFFF